ncbi:TPA: hypothetical protein I6Z44_002720 [Vibrio cholerae]|nr:hypothetical protein [Vibrio cholerae]
MKKLLITLMAVVLLSGCDSRKDGMITLHEAYRMSEELFPTPIREKLKAILEDSETFGMTEYQELDLAIQKNCDGTEYTWRDYASLLPMKIIAFVAPGWNSFAVMSSPELLLVRQIDAANTCVFNSLTQYIEE